MLSLIAIITGSQQMMVLPKSDSPEVDDSWTLPPKQDLEASIGRLRSSVDPHELKLAVEFTLQTPIMFLSLSVITFLAGVCATVYSPLSQNVAWTPQAKVSFWSKTHEIVSESLNRSGCRDVYNFQHLHPCDIYRNLFSSAYFVQGWSCKVMICWLK